MEGWLWVVAVVTIFKTLVIVYSSVVNDMVFAYHRVILIMWGLLLAGKTPRYWPTRGYGPDTPHLH